MEGYKAPQRDAMFVTHELLDYQRHYQALGFDEASEDLVSAIFAEAAKFSENTLAPINQSGDEEGCTWNDGNVNQHTSTTAQSTDHSQHHRERKLIQ